MKRITFILAILPFTAVILAQMPQKMSYQAVIRDPDNDLVVNQTVGMRINILQGTANGEEVYNETFNPSTNANGLVTIEIGDNAGFGAIDWSAGPYFIQTAIDPAGGSNYSISGTSQLLAVPYAMHARSAETVGIFDAAEPGAMLYWDGNKWVAIPPGETGETLTFCNGVPTWGPCPGMEPDDIATGDWQYSAGSGLSGILSIEDNPLRVLSIRLDFDDWTCGSSNRLGGSVTLSWTNGIEIRDRNLNLDFTIYQGPKFTFEGQFEDDGANASGAWNATYDGNTCSGTWQAQIE